MNLEGVLSGRGGDRAVRELLLGGAPAAVADLVTTMLGGRSGVRDCRLRRAHLKPGRRLSTEWELELAGRRAPLCVAAAWYVDGPPAGFAEAASRAEAELREAGTPAPLPRLWAVDPARGVTLLAAPLDPAFPGLGPLSDPTRLGVALADSAAEPGGAAGTGTVRAVRYRPGQRHVLEYRRRGAPSLFVKLYRPGEGAPVAAAVRGLAGLLDSAAVARIHVVRPAAVLGDGDALVYRRAPGIPLSRPLSAGVAPVAAHPAHVGLLLRTVHAAQPVVPLPVRDGLDAEVRTVLRACEAMAALRPDLGARAAEIAARAGAALAAAEQEAPAPVHGDMKADHMLFGKYGLHVLDADRCALADPAYDVGKMVADLRVWGLSGAGPHAGAAERTMLDAYAGAGSRMRRAELYAGLLLVRMAARRVPLAAPDWAERTATLLGAAEGALDAGDRA